MFDKERFKFALENYKKDFPTWWEKEKYKWEAVKCFQDNWNIDAVNFSEMLTNSLQKLNQNLIYGFAKNIILSFVEKEPETVREMFKALFDENQEILERFRNFNSQSENLFKKYPYKNEINSHQAENTISAYLWLKYPEKYYLYSSGKAQITDKFLKSQSNDIKEFFTLYDEICTELKNDSELVSMLKDKIYKNPNCYEDLNLKTLTVDFGFYVYKNHQKFLSSFQTNISSSFKPTSNSYSAENFLSEVFISAEKYQTLVATLERKKNIILQGAPGVGKTFAAKRLAYSIIGAKDDSKIEFVQFHQNYSYEDFVIGYKPTENNFELQTGIFYNFCKKAEENLGEKFFFIIDEINRGNLSKIFGELLMLIETDKRGEEKIKLSTNAEIFSVPENLYIIGMMNTADRSLALIDYALRRRFSFFEMLPAFDSEIFIEKYKNKFNNKIFDKLIAEIKNLNAEISADSSLGKGFCIGHSYFCLENCEEKILRSIVDYDILPMLEEYWFDNPEKVEEWKNNLRGVFND